MKFHTIVLCVVLTVAVVNCQQEEEEEEGVEEHIREVRHINQRFNPGTPFNNNRGGIGPGVSSIKGFNQRIAFLLYVLSCSCRHPDPTLAVDSVVDVDSSDKTAFR